MNYAWPQPHRSRASPRTSKRALTSEIGMAITKVTLPKFSLYHNHVQNKDSLALDYNSENIFHRWNEIHYLKINLHWPRDIFDASAKKIHWQEMNTWGKIRLPQKEKICYFIGNITSLHGVYSLLRRKYLLLHRKDLSPQGEYSSPQSHDSRPQYTDFFPQRHDSLPQKHDSLHEGRDSLLLWKYSSSKRQNSLPMRKDSLLKWKYSFP